MRRMAISFLWVKSSNAFSIVSVSVSAIRLRLKDKGFVKSVWV
jgi:hypothetical protein